MLVISRKVGEKVHIGGTIVLTIVAIEGQRIRLGVEAPTNVRVLRGELLESPQGPVPCIESTLISAP